MSSFGPPVRAAQRKAGSTSPAAASPPGASRWSQARAGTATTAGAVGAWKKVAQAGGGERRDGVSPPALSPAGVRFQSRLKEAEQIILVLREQSQQLQVQLDDSRGEAADATLRLELVLAEATRRGVDLRGWLLEQVGDGGTPLARALTPAPISADATSATIPPASPKNRDSSHHTTPGWGMIRSDLAENPKRQVPDMAELVVKAAFPPERLEVETKRVKKMSRDVSKRKKSETKAQLRAKQSEAAKRDALAKAAARRRRETTQKDRDRKVVARQKVTKAADKQKTMKGEGWQVRVRPCLQRLQSRAFSFARHSHPLNLATAECARAECKEGGSQEAGRSPAGRAREGGRNRRGGGRQGY